MTAMRTHRRPSSDTTVHRSRAMGSAFVLEVSGDPRLIRQGRRRVAELESRWSRFLPGSDIARCNETRGIPVFVHADTRRLVRHAVEAWRRSDGAVDPTVLDALIAVGYDRPYDELADDGPLPDPSASAVPGCAGIEVDDELGSMRLPPNAGFDPGAVGKGLAADIIAAELVDAGADGVFVGLGGDIRTAGRPACRDGWSVAVRGPDRGADVLATMIIPEAGLATSTTRRRRWRRAGVDHHHVIDPRTGRPAAGDVVQVTAIAGEAWWAEALATTLMLSPRSVWSEAIGDAAALVVDRDHTIAAVGRMEEFLR